MYSQVHNYQIYHVNDISYEAFSWTLWYDLLLLLGNCKKL